MVLRLLLITFNRKYMKIFTRSLIVDVGYWFLKKLKIMKLIIALTLVFNLNSFAKSWSQTKVTLNVHAVELKKVLALIEKQSNYHFLFSERKLETDQKVDVIANDEEVTALLSRMLANIGYTYYELNNQLIVVTQKGSEAQDKIKVTGKVLSENGAPLAGASVRVRGTAIGVATDSTGSFVLNVEPNAVLIVSSLGYQAEEIPVNGRTSLTLALKATTAALNDVVVVGYGKQKKIDVTGAVSSVDGDKDLNWKPVGQVSQALQGTMPGVTVTQNSGQPGLDKGTINIRGVGTLNDNTPLVLVDGVQYDINDVDANDIATVSVLKDAAASSIYGVRAANGVVLITTKRGANNKAKVSYSDYFGWQRAAHLPEYVGAPEYMKLINQTYINSGGGAVYSDSVIAQYNNPDRNTDLYPNNNWIRDILTGSGFQQQHSISVAGGAENIKYRFSTNYFDQKGLVTNMDFSRITVRLNTDINITKKLTFSADMSARLSNRTEPQDVGAGSAWLQFQSVNIAPTTVNKYSDGTWGPADNPIRLQLEGGKHEYKSNLITGNFRANYELVKGLTISGIASVNYDDSYISLHNRELDYYNFFITPHPLIATKGLNEITKEYTAFWFRNFQALVDYKKDFGGHSFHLLAGSSSLYESNDALTGYRKNIPNGTLEEINAGAADGQSASGTGDEYALLSYFGRFNYNYRDKYLFEANLRHDGSSRFAEGNKWGTFPSFSAGWRISGEEFMKDVTAFQDLKIRGSWGKLGNDNTVNASGVINNYPYQSTFSFNSAYPFGGSLYTAASLGVYPNPLLTWETTKMTDVGVDVTTLGRKLDISFDYYVKKTDNILLQLPVPLTVGLSAPYVNAGVVQNKGWEVAVGYHDVIGKDFKYNIRVNLSDVKNKVLDMKDGDYLSTANDITNAYYKGLPIGSFWGYKSTGIFRTQQQVDAHAPQPGTIAPGDLAYKNLNGDTVIDASDRTYIGSNIPRYTYGVNLGASYKGFDLSMMLQGVLKVDVYTRNMLKATTSQAGNFLKIHEDAWTADNPDASFPRLLTNTQNYVSSTYWISSGAYLRLKSVQLGYTIPSALMNKAGFSRFRIYVSGQNLLTFSGLNSSIDPEAPSDNRYYPQVKTYTFGCNLDF